MLKAVFSPEGEGGTILVVNGRSASTSSAVLAKRASGVFCIRRSTTAASSFGKSGTRLLIGLGCLNWWAIIFSAAVPSGKG